MKTGKILAAILLSLAVGCSAEDPDSMEMGEPDAGITDIEPAAVPLSIDPIESLTPFDTVKVTGQGPAGGRLNVYSPASGNLAPKPINSDGSFCIDVPLQLGTTNKISFEAIDASGEVSETLFRDVTQDGEPPVSTGGSPSDPPLVNAARGASMSRTSMDVMEGSAVANMVDDSASFAHIQNDWWSSDWIAFDLGESVPVEQIQLLSDSECHVRSYKILLSNSADPFADDEDPFGYDPLKSGTGINAEWDIVAQNTSGTPYENLTPGSPNWVFNLGIPTARHVAIYFLNSSSGSCNPLVGEGTHKIIDLRVMTEGDGTEPPPAPGADMCVR